MEDIIAMVREFNALSNSACNFLSRSRIMSGFELAIPSVFSDGAKRVADRMDCEFDLLSGCNGADVMVAARSTTCRLGAERVDGRTVRVEPRALLYDPSEGPFEAASRIASRRNVPRTLWLVVNGGSTGGFDLVVDEDTVGLL